MDVGQVKSGVDKHDTFVKMMQEVNRITAPMAYGIASQYPCVTDLVRGMRMHGNMMLEDIKVAFMLLRGPLILIVLTVFCLEIREQEWFVDECAHWARC
jgi:hypothetical protein